MGSRLDGLKKPRKYDTGTLKQVTVKMTMDEYKILRQYAATHGKPMSDVLTGWLKPKIRSLGK